MVGPGYLPSAATPGGYGLVVSGSAIDPVTIRLGSADDDEQIAQLLADGAPGNPKADLDVLRWQYRSEVYGPTLTVVAEAEGRIVGHYSAITLPVRIDGTPVRALRGVDIVTAVDHRRRGVFRRVATHLRDAAREAGAELLISTPNDQSLGTLQSLGWTLVGDPWAMVIVTQGRALAARAPGLMPVPVGVLATKLLGLRHGRHRPDGDTAVSGTVPEDLPDDLAQLSPLVEPANGVVHGRAWWQWRYRDHPNHPYRFVTFRRQGRLAGVGVVSVRDDDIGPVLQLLDVFAEDPEAVRSVTYAATRLARDLDLGAVVAAALGGSDLHTLLRKAGFVTIPRRWQPRPIHVAAVDLTGELASLAGRTWAFSLGDQDHL
jgi:GNAT superfamily N-acetyltransferase